MVHIIWTILNTHRLCDIVNVTWSINRTFSIVGYMFEKRQNAIFSFKIIGCPRVLSLKNRYCTKQLLIRSETDMLHITCIFESLESRIQKSTGTTENERWICLLLKRPRCNFTDLYRFTDEIHIKSVITAIFSRQLFAVPVFSVYHFFSCLRDRWFEHWGNWGILSRVGCFETGWLEALPCFKVVAPNSFSSFEIFLPSHKVNSSLFLQKWEKSFPFMLAKLVFKWVTPAGSSTVWSMESLQMVP